MPARIFINVDFPAPFSPIKPTISERWTLKAMESSARTPGNRFEIPVICRRGGAGEDGSEGESRLAAPQRIGFRDELINVVFLDNERRNELLFVGGNARSVTGQNFIQQLDRLITELVGLL